MLQAMHDIMFALGQPLIWVAIGTLLSGVVMSVFKRDLRYSAVGAFTFITIIVVMTLYVLVYWLAGGLTAFPNG